MELNYFIEETNTSENVAELWLNNSSLASRSFIGTKSTNLTGVIDNNNFCILFTLDKKNSNPGIIFSNWETYGGFAVGINSNNQIFALASSPDVDSFYFPQLRLPTKSCLGIYKNNTSLSVAIYDLNSRKIYDSYSALFQTNTLTNGGQYRIGNNEELNSRYQIAGISGIFDQLAVFSPSIDIPLSEKVFSGFLPFDITGYSTVSGLTYDYSYEQSSEPSLSNQIMESFFPFLKNLESSIAPQENNVVGSFSGTKLNNSYTIQWSGLYYISEDYPDFPTGQSYNAGSNFYIYTGLPFSNSINFINSFDRSTNSDDQTVTNHIFNYTYSPDPTKENYLFYSSNSQTSGSSVPVFSNPLGSYITGMFMDGVAVDKKGCFLYTYGNRTFEEVNLELPFDPLVGKFIATNGFVSGYNLYDASGKVNNYSISQGYINI